MVIRMNISYDSYRVFYYVAKYRSFTQAAAVLMNNQPNVTRTIKNLEQALGCKLFARSHRGAELTPEGERLYEHISRAFAHIQTGEEELTAERGLQGGVVTISASEISLRCCLLPLLRDYRKRYPGVRIRMFNHPTPQAIDVLKNGLADFAMVTTPAEVPDSLQERTVMEIQEVPICGATFSELWGRRLSLPELAEYPLICLGPNTSTFAFYSDFFARQTLALRPDIEAATADQILPMVRGQLGVGFVPESFLQDEGGYSDIRRLDLKTPIPKRKICFLKQRRQYLSRAAKELEAMILDACADYELGGQDSV